MEHWPTSWTAPNMAGPGGNGMINGSTAYIMVAPLSERTRTPITSALWYQRGLPMVATCVVISILFVPAYPVYLR